MAGMKATEEKKRGPGLPVCPYCGKKINPVYAWGMKSKGEFHCSQCGTFSNIRLNSFIYGAGIAALAAEALILVLFVVTGSDSMFLLPLMILPFLVFTVLAAFSVRLEKIGISRRRPPAKNGAPQQRAHHYEEEKRPPVKNDRDGAFSIEKDTTLQFQKMKNKDHPKRIDDTK